MLLLLLSFWMKNLLANCKSHGIICEKGFYMMQSIKQQQQKLIIALAVYTRNKNVHIVEMVGQDYSAVLQRFWNTLSDIELQQFINVCTAVESIKIPHLQFIFKNFSKCTSATQRQTEENTIQLGTVSHIWMPISKTNTENHLGPGNINVIFVAGFTSGHIRFSDAGVVQFPGFVPQNSLDYQ